MCVGISCMICVLIVSKDCVIVVVYMLRITDAVLCVEYIKCLLIVAAFLAEI